MQVVTQLALQEQQKIFKKARPLTIERAEGLCPHMKTRWRVTKSGRT